MTDDLLIRCPWVDLTKPDYIAYHDQEWGVPVRDDRTMFEFLTLESAQAGLSWYTVLRKRDAYRQAFAGFDPQRVARFGARDIQRLMNNPGIIRNRRKIEAAIHNAKCFLELQAQTGSFTDYLWGFVEGRPQVNRIHRLQDYPATSPISDSVSKELKRRGFKFVGSTICYAHLQATGLINDHALNCFRRQQIIDGYE